MKRWLLLILPIVVVVTAVFIVLGVFQQRKEESRLLDDLRRRSRALAEAMELSVQGALAGGDSSIVEYIVQKFQNRERLQGCVIYDREGGIVALTERFSEWKNKDKPYIRDILAFPAERGGLETFNEYSVYSYVFPIFDKEKNFLGLLEILHDTSYVFGRSVEIWKSISISLLVLVILIAWLLWMIQKHVFMAPVLQLTEWFKRFQKGETTDHHTIKDKDEIGKLAEEVEQVALNLKVARNAVSREAITRIEKEDTWTEKKLRDLVHARLGDNAFFVVSNREPYMHVRDKASGDVKCVRPASGVVTALDPILRACGGMWVAHGSGDSDRQFVNSKDKLGVPPKEDKYILKRVWLSKEEEQGYYYGFSNEGLWPLCHLTHTRPEFRETDWQMYKAVNRKFAQSVLDELPIGKSFIFIQDYHFTLLAKFIKEKRPDVTIAIFWHIPWPNSEAFAICPYQKEILDGMLHCDLIGFHVQNDCNSFLDAANRFLESRVDTERFSVIRDRRETLVRPYPISVDVASCEHDAKSIAPQVAKIRKDLGLEGKIVALGVERIDYTKGISERILAVERFLDKYPQYKDKFVFVQLAAPSRTHIKRYHDLMSEIDQLVDRVNWKYDGPVKPVIYLKRHFSQEEIAPFNAIADICIVSSLHDGMNLVAKEFVASKKDLNGVLILSRFTGAAREFTDAIQVNPYAIEEFADRIKTAVDMPQAEKQRRMENMRAIIREKNIFRWAGNIVTDLTSIPKKKS